MKAMLVILLGGSLLAQTPVIIKDSAGVNAATVSAGGAVKVDGSAVVQPVSGTFWQTTQPVSGTFWQATQPVSIATMPSTPVTGTFWQTTQPVSGTFFQATQPVSCATAATCPVNSVPFDGTNQMGVMANFGTTPTAVKAISANVSLFQGTVAVGTAAPLQVSLANTGANTNKLLVTPDSVALPANQSVNISQMNGVTTSMGNGTTDTGTQRVTLSSDSTGQVKLATGANTIGALTANQSINVAQVNGVTTVTAASGVQKVGIVGNAGAAVDAATGAAPPANAILYAGLGSGATGGFMTGITVCDSFFNINISTATTTLAITGVSGRHVRICAISMVALAADNVGIISGTGATCGTGTGAIVGTTAATGYNLSANGGIAMGTGIGTIMRTVATGDSVCIVTSAATQLSGVISYAIY